MSMPLPGSTKQSKLRLDAEARLKDGTAAPSKGWLTSATALHLLHSLASTPEKAEDALKLLHELQVHQVELDLQHEQMESELTEDLARYQAFYEFAPMAFLSLGLEGDILEGNVAAARLCGVGQGELQGRRIEAVLASESRSALRALLKRLRAHGLMESCEVQSSLAPGSGPLQLRASVAPDGRSILAVLVDTSDRRQPDPHV